MTSLQELLSRSVTQNLGLSELLDISQRRAEQLGDIERGKGGLAAAGIMGQSQVDVARTQGEAQSAAAKTLGGAQSYVAGTLGSARTDVAKTLGKAQVEVAGIKANLQLDSAVGYMNTLMQISHISSFGNYGYSSSCATSTSASASRRLFCLVMYNSRNAMTATAIISRPRPYQLIRINLINSLTLKRPKRRSILASKRPSTARLTVNDTAAVSPGSR